MAQTLNFCIASQDLFLYLMYSGFLLVKWLANRSKNQSWIFKFVWQKGVVFFKKWSEIRQGKQNVFEEYMISRNQCQPNHVGLHLLLKLLEIYIFYVKGDKVSIDILFQQQLMVWIMAQQHSGLFKQIWQCRGSAASGGTCLQDEQWWESKRLVQWQIPGCY